MPREYKRQHEQYERYGTQVWVQKRSKGNERQFSLCENCAVVSSCNRVVGLGNFCDATKMTVLVWECPAFRSIHDE